MKIKHLNFEQLMLFTNSFYKLKEIYRTGWIQKLGLSNPETVASHTLLMVVLVLFFSDKYSYSNKKKVKLIEMVLIHDLGESIIGDITPDSMKKNKKMILEKRAFVSIVEKISIKNLKNNYLRIWEEYNANQSFESRFVHLIDKLEMVLQARYYLENRKDLKKEDLNPFFQSALFDVEQIVKLDGLIGSKYIKNKIHLEEIKEILAHLCK